VRRHKTGKKAAGMSKGAVGHEGQYTKELLFKTVIERFLAHYLIPVPVGESPSQSGQKRRRIKQCMPTNQTSFGSG
jgi:hypothetical protein